MKRWYVISCKDREEAIDNLGAQRFEVFMPLLKVRTDRGMKAVSMFGMYIFVQFDIEADRWQKINNTRGVRELLCMDPETPSPVPVGVVEEMIRQEEKNGYVSELEKVFSVGDRVEITSGAFEGHSGLVTFSSTKRVAILFHLLGAENKLYISPDQIEKI